MLTPPLVLRFPSPRPASPVPDLEESLDEALRELVRASDASSWSPESSRPPPPVPDERDWTLVRHQSFVASSAPRWSAELHTPPPALHTDDQSFPGCDVSAWSPVRPGQPTDLGDAIDEVVRGSIPVIEAAGEALGLRDPVTH